MKQKQTLLSDTELTTASLATNTDLHTVGSIYLPSLPGQGFPLWHQDENGTVLDFCLPNASNPGAFSPHTKH
jgi:hypothetical protein